VICSKIFLKRFSANFGTLENKRVQLQMVTGLSLCRSGNGVGHINKVKVYVKPGYYWDWRPLAGLYVPSRPSSRPLRLTQSGHPSVGRCNEYWRWCRPLRGKKRRVLFSV